MTDELMVLTREEAVEVFTGNGMDDFLESVENKVAKFYSDVSTPEGRKSIKSDAYSLARLKTTIDNFGKELVSGWKQKSKVVDTQRKNVRYFLDELKDNFRKPLTDWEEKEAREAEEIREAARNKIIREAEEKHRELKEKEEELARKEQEIKDREIAMGQAERDKEVAEEARKKAESYAKEEIEKVKMERAQAETRARLEAERAEQDKFEAVEQAKREEQEKQIRIQMRKEEEGRIKKEADEKKSMETEHRRAINKEALSDLISFGLNEETSKELILSISTNKIRNISINY